MSQIEPRALERADRSFDEMDTKERLLESAGQVFAEQGFRSATIRQICERAKANVAAINYHFGDKEKLYQEVLRHRLKDELRVSAFKGISPSASPEERLRAFVRAYVQKILGREDPLWLAKLISLEMIDPTPALDTLVSEIFEPNFRELKEIVRQVSLDRLGDGQISLCAWSVCAQWLVYHFGRAVIERTERDRTLGPEEIEKVTDHITKFSLSAIRGIAGL